MHAVQMQHITKSFGSLKANDDVTLAVRTGDIHALVGENGAGKSTLMNILYGMLQPDGGEIFINGKQLPPSYSPKEAIAMGVGMVHQHFMLVPPLTVAENVILGSEPTGPLGSLDRRRIERSVGTLSDQYHLAVDPRARIEDISVGLQQRVEILKLLYRNASILILDEPTAVLAPQEVGPLFDTLRHLKSQGKTIILITHKLDEVTAISDRVTVMRRGKVSGNVETSATTSAELARLMVGKEVTLPVSQPAEISMIPVLSVEHVSLVSERKISLLDDVSCTVHAGEILGIAAVEGNGQHELVQIIAGLRQPTSGKVAIQGEGQENLAHIPGDRHRNGVILDFSVEENLLLGRQREPRFNALVGLRRRAIEDYATEMVKTYAVHPPDIDHPLRGLSGGNQQKVVVARELSKGAPLILANHPTRGLDIGATAFVHEALLRERDRGIAVLLVSSDITELLALSDRIAVMFRGRIVATLPARGTSEHEIGAYMTGAAKE